MIHDMNARRPHAATQRLRPPSRPPSGRLVVAKATTKPPTRPPTRPATQVRPPSGSVAQADANASQQTVLMRRSQRVAAQAKEPAQKPDVITWRLVMLTVVGLLLMGLIAPTLRGALDQHQQFTALEAEYAEALAQSDRLDIEIARWDDPAFVESQARTRLSYVYHGDKVWRPIGTDILAEDIDPATGLRVKQGIVGASKGLTWYEALIESIKVADGPVEHPDEPDDLNALLPPRDE